MLKKFEGKEVEVFEWNGKVLFNPKHVAECLDIADVNSSIRSFNGKQVIKLKNSDMHNMHIRKLNNLGVTNVGHGDYIPENIIYEKKWVTHLLPIIFLIF